VYLEAPSSVDNMHEVQLFLKNGSVKFTQERSMQLLEVIECLVEIMNEVLSLLYGSSNNCVYSIAGQGGPTSTHLEGNSVIIARVRTLRRMHSQSPV